MPGCVGGANQPEAIVVSPDVHWIVLVEEVPVAVEVGWDERVELERHFAGKRWFDEEREVVFG